MTYTLADLLHARSTLPQNDEGLYNLDETKLTFGGDMKESTYEPLDWDVIGAVDESEKYWKIEECLYTERVREGLGCFLVRK